MTLYYLNDHHYHHNSTTGSNVSNDHQNGTSRLNWKGGNPMTFWMADMVFWPVWASVPWCVCFFPSFLLFIVLTFIWNYRLCIPVPPTPPPVAPDGDERARESRLLPNPLPTPQHSTTHSYHHYGCSQHTVSQHQPGPSNSIMTEGRDARCLASGKLLLLLPF